MPPRIYCNVYGCFNAKHRKPELAFFGLPTDVESRAQWLRLIYREDLADRSPRNYHVCEEHFHPKEIMPAKTRKTLKKKAIPSRNLPDLSKFNVLELTVASKETQTEVITARVPETRKRKRKNILELRKILQLHESDEEGETGKRQRNSFHELCDKFLTKELAELVKTQAQLILNCNENRQEKFNMFCLNLYYTSPKAYRLLQNAICLPSPNILTKRIPATTKIDDRIISALKIKVEGMNDMDKNCSVVIGTIRLKSNLFYNITEDKIIGFQEIDGVKTAELAKKALVVTVRGVCSDWTQPVGFALLSDGEHWDQTAKWIDKLLEKLFEIGLNVRAFISDVEPDQFNAAEKRSVTVERPYFLVNNRKVYYIFDATHLIRTVRDNFIEYDFQFQDRVARYEHVIKFYQIDKQRSMKLAHKLTIRHVQPTDAEKLKVEYATQLLSNSVATGMSTYVDFNAIEDSAGDTVVFIQMMNNLFDALNSSDQNENEHKTAFSGQDKQVAFFNEMLIFIQQLRIIDPTNVEDVTSHVRFIHGFQITIKSILLLFEDLQNQGCKSLSTKKLNRDVLETFFKQIQKKSDKELTCRQFVSAFKKIFLVNIVKATKSGDSADDLGKLIIRVNNIRQLNDEGSCNDDNMPDTNDMDAESNIKIKRSDYNQLNLPKIDPILYISGYLLKECAERHDCPVLKSYMNKDVNNKDAVVADDFIEYIEEMDKMFHLAFERIETLDCKIAESIYEEINKISFSAPCSCFPITYLKKLFIRMKIFNTIKTKNKAFRLNIEENLNIFL